MGGKGETKRDGGAGMKSRSAADSDGQGLEMRKVKTLVDSKADQVGEREWVTHSKLEGSIFVDEGVETLGLKVKKLVGTRIRK